MKGMLRVCAVIVCSTGPLLAFAATGNGNYRDVQVLQSDETGITMEYRPEYFSPRTIVSSGRTYIDYNFYGGVSPSPENVGSPNLRHRAITLTFPSIENNSVEVLGTTYEDFRDQAIVPVPLLVRDPSGLGAERLYEESSDAYGKNQFFPTPIATLGAVGQSRANLVGNLELFPIQYNPAAGVIRRYSSIVVRVHYGTMGRSAGRVVENEMLKRSALNYDVGKNWAVEQPHIQGTGVINSVLATGDWYRIDVKTDGIYRLDAATLSAAGINLGQIDPRTIKIYGNGGLEMPQNSTASRPIDLVENAILVVGEADGKFDSGDYILFYGKGVRGWRYNSATRSFSHYIHHYIDSNYYWLTYGGSSGKRMASLQSLTEQNVLAAQKTLGKIFLEEEKNKTEVNSGLEWYGQFFDAGNRTAVIANRLDGLITTDPINYKFVFVSRSGGFAAFRVEDNSASLGTVVIPPVNLASITTEYARKSNVASFQRPGNLPNQQSLVRITYDPASSTDKGYLDWMEIFYSRDFSAVNDFLNFTSPDTTATVEYNLGNFSTSNISVFEVSDYANARVVTGAAVSGGNFKFQARQQAGSVSEYIGVGPNGFRAPLRIQKMGNSNLHGFADGADFIIISPSEFLSDAQRLKAHRERPGSDRLNTLVVNVQDVYNEFSGGLLDPTAIRDYLKYAYENWAIKPRYVLLFGGGSFDYKNVLTKDRNWIPPYESLETLYQINTYCTDDYYAQIVGTDPIVDLAIGRLPVHSAQEARIAVDKIIRYETASSLDQWKNRITYVADDGLTSTGDDGPIHTAQAEDLAERYTPGEFEKSKIYIVEYPTVNTAGGRRKPTAFKAVLQQFNDGTLIINFTGHGNPEVWAHEHVFERETTIPQLVNRDKLAFVVAATCDFARYDDPIDRGATDLMLIRENGGSIGTLSSTRVVYSFDNSEFNNSFFSFLLVRNPERKLARLGDALFSVKQTRYGVNDTKFGLFGDPTLRLTAPTFRAQMDTINGSPATSMTQLKALGKVSIQGTIRKPDGSVWTDFNGKLVMTVFDSKKRVPVPEWFGFTFSSPGGFIFRGENTVSGGKFSATFFVPKDISYENNQGRITAYFSDQSLDGSGYTENVLVGGTDTTTIPTLQGPRISVYLDSRSFRSGDLVGENPLLLIDYFAEHGINTASGGIGHQLEARIDEQTSPIDLTAYYKGRIDSYQEGTVEYRLADLTEGKHLLKARAWDIFNNSATAEVAFEVTAGSELRVSNVLNYPNPFSRSTTFTFQQNQLAPLDVEIKVYTLAGRVVKVIHAPGVADRFVQIPWDGRDQDGDELANGVYFYRLIAKTIDGSRSAESIGKLAVLK
jgi:hypothetical protein